MEKSHIEMFYGPQDEEPDSFNQKGKHFEYQPADSEAEQNAARAWGETPESHYDSEDSMFEDKFIG